MERDSDIKEKGFLRAAFDEWWDKVEIDEKGNLESIMKSIAFQAFTVGVQTTLNRMFGDLTKLRFDK